MSQIAHDPAARPDGLAAADLAAILPASAEVREGHLWLGGVDLVELAQEQGTALYVFDEAEIRDRLATWLLDLVSEGLDASVVYAGKAFLCKAMCRLVAESGAWLDVSGGGELAMARSAGFATSRIIMHGNAKTRVELIEAIGSDVGRIVVDSLEELERISDIAPKLQKTQRIMLRLTPGVAADTHSYVVTAAEDSKFGFSIASGAAMAAARKALVTPGVLLTGFHLHVGSQIFTPEAHERALVKVFDFLAHLRQESGYEVEELDIGGGLGVPYTLADVAKQPVSIGNFAFALAHCLRELSSAHSYPLPRIFVEPGRSVVANAGLTLYTVGVVKDLPGIRTWVAVDGGMSDNIRTALYDARYEVLNAERADEPRNALVTVCGKHCESGDVVAIDASVQLPKPGEVLAVLATGAYNHSMASNYNGQTRPAVVFVRDGEARLVLRRESYKDLLAREVD